MQKFISSNFHKLLTNQEARTKCLDKFKRSTKINIYQEKQERQSAVLIPVLINEDDVKILYTVRSTNLRTHKGQVSFPGGIFDDEDGKSATNCALRETEEEIGISKEHIKIWGEGEQLSMRMNLSITPVIGSIENFSNDMLKLNKDEVEKVFTVGIEELINPDNRQFTQFKQNYSLPVYLVEGEKIWGMTAIITHLFLCSFLPKDCYPKNLGFVGRYKL